MRRISVVNAVQYRLPPSALFMQVGKIVANGTRLWIYCAPGGSSPLDEGAQRPEARLDRDPERMSDDLGRHLLKREITWRCG